MTCLLAYVSTLNRFSTPLFALRTTQWFCCSHKQQWPVCRRVILQNTHLKVWPQQWHNFLLNCDLRKWGIGTWHIVYRSQLHKILVTLLNGYFACKCRTKIVTLAEYWRWPDFFWEIQLEIVIWNSLKYGSWVYVGFRQDCDSFQQTGVSSMEPPNPEVRHPAWHGQVGHQCDAQV